ncbi:MAG: UDP-3-O-(3-hydroxymyristoyl)glucosamine N-acyltransferase [Desulfobacteraceae bacterium]|nr:UDP-3-O-(3-hydroxymyristoyl)glucosamine N-acyltransferase [Desulfobacteraceae bacterium]
MEFTLKKIAEFVSGKLTGDPDLVIGGAAPFEAADHHQITFVEKKSLLTDLSRTKAAAVIIPSGTNLTETNLIHADNPRLAFAKVLALFQPFKKPAGEIHPSAVIGDGVTKGKDVFIGPGVVIGNKVVLGDGVVLYSNTVIGNDVVIGNDSVIYPNASILDGSIIGQRVIIHSGAVIGSDGYGFVKDSGRCFKIPQTGIVQIDDDVEIGANCTIDRATFGRTWIKTGVKMDNLVHIAHNVVIGENSLIIAQVGIAGSVTIGRDTIIAGQAGIGDHLTIGDGTIVGPRTGVAQSLPEKQVVSGSMLAMAHSTWLRTSKLLPKLPELKKKIDQLENKLKALGNT